MHPWQVQADHAALSLNADSQRSIRLFWTGLGVALLVLIVLSASALQPSAPHDSVEPSRLLPEVAFNPMPALSPRGIPPSRHPGSAYARPKVFRAAYSPGSRRASLPRVKQLWMSNQMESNAEKEEGQSAEVEAAEGAAQTRIMAQQAAIVADYKRERSNGNAPMWKTWPYQSKWIAGKEAEESQEEQSAVAAEKAAETKISNQKSAKLPDSKFAEQNSDGNAPMWKTWPYQSKRVEGKHTEENQAIADRDAPMWQTLRGGANVADGDAPRGNTDTIERRPLTVDPQPSRQSTVDLQPSTSSAQCDETICTEPKSYLRMFENEDGSWELQSGQITYATKNGTEINMIAMVHVGDKEYFKSIESDLLASDAQGEQTITLFELLTDENNVLDPKTDGSMSKESGHKFDTAGLQLPRLRVPLGPSADAQRLAVSQGLCAQLDAIDFKKPNWYVADCSSQTLRKLKDNMTLAEQDTESSMRPALLEALLVALMGRAKTMPKAAQFARSFIWLVPCPEAQLLLFDWIWAGGRPAPVLGAILDAISAGNIAGARKLAFAQMLVSAQNAKDVYGSGAGAVATINARNTFATQRIREALDEVEEHKSERNSRIAVLYGGAHVPGLCKALEYDLDCEQVNLSWRKVLGVEKARENWFARYGFIVVLLLLDGLDWTNSLNFIAEASFSDKWIEAALYLTRHVAVYYAFGKWVLEWNRDLFAEALPVTEGRDSS